MTSNGIHLRMDTSATYMTSTSADAATLASPSPQTSTFVKTAGTTNGNYTDTIPPDNSNRTLVLCFDGTGDQFDADNSNIITLFGMLKKDDPSKQLVYYQAGIGTYTVPQIATPGMAKLSKTLDMMVAWNMDAHIMGGYEFLMQNYQAGDRICIFGFSRGAYTARCLAGMIHKVGLLPSCNHQQVPFAYKMYTQSDETGWKQSNLFKKTFSIDVDIEFVGVWDTVNSVGLIPRRLPFSTSNTVVRTFRHAVSLDERRAKFKANMWNRPNDTEKFLSITDQAVAVTAAKSQGHTHPHAKKPTLRALETRYSLEDRVKPTDIDEVWFSGCHCDIGGGSVGNGVKPSLARIPLRWMIRECFKTNTGILFHVDGLKDVGLDPASLYPYVLSRPEALSPSSNNAVIQPIPNVPEKVADEEGVVAVVHPEQVPETEEEVELKDALSPLYDQLSLKWFWWLLEFIPLKHRYQARDNTWAWTYGWNLGGGRRIPKQKHLGVRVHRSVKTRLEAEYANGQKYKPKANLDLEHVTWVD